MHLYTDDGVELLVHGCDVVLHIVTILGVDLVDGQLSSVLLVLEV